MKPRDIATSARIETQYMLRCADTRMVELFLGIFEIGWGVTMLTSVGHRMVDLAWYAGFAAPQGPGLTWVAGTLQTWLPFIPPHVPWGGVPLAVGVLRLVGLAAMAPRFRRWLSLFGATEWAAMCSTYTLAAGGWYTNSTTYALVAVLNLFLCVRAGKWR